MKHSFDYTVTFSIQTSLTQLLIFMFLNDYCGFALKKSVVKVPTKHQLSVHTVRLSKIDPNFDKMYNDLNQQNASLLNMNVQQVCTKV